MSVLPSTETLELPQGPADLHKRVAVELLARISAEGRASIRDKAREDPVWFIDYLGFTFDPRLPGEEATIPFLLYDYQRELIRELVARIDAGRDPPGVPPAHVPSLSCRVAIGPGCPGTCPSPSPSPSPRHRHRPQG